MAEKFDPYYRWLGIPPADQPPNLYRLLGVQVFEADREVIDAVANRHITYLQEITSGPNVTAAQQLLNELAGARRTLLKPALKEKYDAQLKQELAAKEAPPEARKPAPRRSKAGASVSGHGSGVGDSNKGIGAGKTPLVARPLDDIDIAGRETGKVSVDDSAIDTNRRDAEHGSAVIPLEESNTPPAPGSGSGVELDEFERKRGGRPGSSVQLSSLSATQRVRAKKKSGSTGVIVAVVGLLLLLAAGGAVAFVVLGNGPATVQDPVKPPPATTPQARNDEDGDDTPTDFGAPIVAAPQDFSFEVKSLVTWLHGDNAQSPSADGITGRTPKKKLGWQNLSGQQRGGVMDFDGKSATKLPRAAYYDFTFCVWLKTTQKQPSGGEKKWDRGAVLLCSTEKNKQRDFGVSLYGGKPMFHVHSQKLNLAADEDLSDGQWRHLAVVYHQPLNPRDNQGRAMIYVDGQQKSEQSFEYKVSAPTTRELILGGLNESNQTTGKFKGQMDELRVYNFALKPEEISRLADPAPPVQNEVWFFAKGQMQKQEVKPVQNKIKANAPADLRRGLYSLQTPKDFRDDYGQRLSCWISVPADGVYQFRTQADDAAQLQIQDAPREGQGGGYRLSSNRRYKLEVLHKEDGGSDLLEVQWQPPGARQMQPIPAAALHANR